MTLPAAKSIAICVSAVVVTLGVGVTLFVWSGAFGSHRDVGCMGVVPAEAEGDVDQRRTPQARRGTQEFGGAEAMG